MRRAFSVLTAAMLVGALIPAAASADNPIPPTATTGDVTARTQTTATLGGTLNASGAPATYVFEYGTSASYGLVTPVRDGGTTALDKTVTEPLLGLTQGTTYHYRIVVTNPAGVVSGLDKTFKTVTAPTAALVTTNAASGVGVTEATLQGTLNPRGQSTSYHFDFGLTGTYGSSTPVVTATGSTARNVSAIVTGLLPNTTYHFRLAANNASGPSLGKDRVLRTTSAPTGITLTATPTAAIWGASVSLHGVVSGSGVGGIGLAAERTDFPFTGTPLVLRTFTTNASGAYATSVGPFLITGRVRVVTRTATVASSPSVDIGVRPRVSLGVVGPRRTSVRLRGSVSPTFTAATASIQRRARSGRWTTVLRTKVHTGAGALTSTYSARIKRPSRTARYRVVVVPNDGGAHLRGTSKQQPRIKAKR